MKQFLALFFALIVSTNAAISNYRYQQPHNQQPQPIRPALPQSNHGIYSGLQPPPLAPQHFAPTRPPAPPTISLPAPPPPAPPLRLSAVQGNNLAAPAPSPNSLPQQQYGPPKQQQQSLVQPTPSTLQQHQQRITHQQLSAPIQGGGSQQQVFQTNQRPQSAIITKDIFIHSAPEDNGSDFDLSPQLNNGPIRKNYRIVFIKAPTQNLRVAAAALKRAQAQQEEKTLIYVLSKKPDLTEVSQQLQQAQAEHKPNKPEVYFIKYKTQEEAQRAQQEIQAQFDALGGSTRVSDEGVVPFTTIGNGGSSGVLSLSGSSGGQNGGGSFSQGGGIQQQSFAQQSFQSQSGAGISQNYLPVKSSKK